MTPDIDTARLLTRCPDAALPPDAVLCAECSTFYMPGLGELCPRCNTPLCARCLSWHVICGKSEGMSRQIGGGA